jgi:hypothetical protein
MGTEASLVWVPVPGFSPGSIRVRWAAPPGESSPLQVFVDGTPSGDLPALGPGFRTDTLRLPPAARDALTRTTPVRLTFRSGVQRAEAGGRSLGAALDLIEVQPDR